MVAARPTLELVGPIAVLSVISAAGTAGAPWLLDWPLVLVGMTPRLPFLALAAQRVGVLPFLMVATTRLCLADPFHFLLGRRLGTGGDRVGRVAQRLARHRLARPVSALAVLLRPNGRHLALAGATGVRVPIVIALDLAGTLLYLAGVRAGTAAFL
jgi:hypothetical protein